VNDTSAARRRRGLGKRERRSVAVFLVASAAAALLITVAALVRREPPPLMPPETGEDVALRTSPDNAYYTLEETAKALPPAPGPVVVESEEIPGLSGPYQPRRADSLGALLNIQRPDDDPELVAYLQESRAAYPILRDALAKPLYRLPDLDLTFAPQRIASVLVADAVYRVRNDYLPETAPALIFDAMALGALVQQDGGIGMFPEAAMVQSTALAHAWETVLRPAPPEARRALLGALRDASIVDRSARRHVEYDWRILDRPGAHWIVLQRPDRAAARARNARDFAERMYMGRQLNRARKHIHEHRETYLEAVDLRLSDYQAFERQQSEAFKFRRMFNPMHGIGGIVAFRAQLEAWLCGMDLVLQLEEVREATGRYPPDLTALPDACSDPFTDQPFLYRVYEDDYTLYSVGPDRRDNGGDRWRSRDIVLQKAAVELEQEVAVPTMDYPGLRLGGRR
jgi:hypothetical protein